MTPGWEELATPAGLGLLDRIAAERDAGRSLDAVSRALRAAGVEPALLAAALTQEELRARAVAKFGERARGMLFTRAALEQATRAEAAALHAERFRAAGCARVADLGCGIGAESLALIAAGVAPLPVELDPLTAAFAAHNLRAAAARAGAPAPEVRLGDAEALGPGDADGAFLDPARRTAGHSDTRRLASPDDYSPSLRFAFGLAERLPTGVKLGPGLDRELIPETAEAQWVSVDGQLVETGLWFGPLARPGIRRAATVVRDGTVAELTGPDDAADAEARGIGAVLYEPDGAVIRARLIGALAERLGAGMLAEGIAYLSADHHIPTPFASAFRVVAELPVRERELRRALADRSIGALEIKKRGADVDPAQLRKRLKLAGPHRATLILTRAEGRRVALLAERL
ncbi:SAM-dependent methyltransferase [Leucobacter allii]|uniref:SAM-dependent methyltransferase n=1 Tax=Leucobacter allii TaxID=2932247 RepID=A0ABY4FNY8_9MICO|nr:SAM-dependent methyltransferase [Leucobacter allii]UOQ57993.1 SAM-dependent methyltransferase [Leucobacter allii]